MEKRARKTYINLVKFVNKLESSGEVRLEGQHFLVGVESELRKFSRKLHVLQSYLVTHLFSDSGRVEIFEGDHLTS